MAIDLLNEAKRSAVVVTTGLAILLLIVGAGQAIDVMMVAFAAILFAIFLHSLTQLVARLTGLAETWALAVTVVLLFAVVAGGTWLLMPSIAEQADQLGQSLPRSVRSLEARVERYEWGRWLLENSPEPDALNPRQKDVFSGITGVLSGTMGAIGLVVVVFFTGLYLAAQPLLYTEGIVKLVAIGKRERAREVLERIGHALRLWLIGKMASMVFVGFFTWLGLVLLGVDIALTLSVLAALLTFIPNFGPILSAVPAVLIGLLDSPMTGVWVAVLYLVVQIIESYLVTPLIQQQTISMPPALTIMAQLAMAVFVGGAGLALATPLTVVVLVLVRTLYVQDILGDVSEADDNGL